MKKLRVFILVLVILVGLLLILAAISPSGYEVSRSADIQCPLEKVYTFTTDFNNFNAWSPWMKKEPTLLTNILGSGREVGSRYDWEGKEFGVGYLIIQDLVPFTQMNQELVISEPYETKSNLMMVFSPIDSITTRVEWQMQGHYSFPFERITMLFYNMEESIALDFDVGLSALKTILESKN